MLSRVAENLYWLSRYVERAEAVSRLVDEAFHLELDAGFEAESPAGRPLHQVLQMQGAAEDFALAHPKGGRDELLEFITFDRDGGQSIRGMVSVARENARGTQQALPGAVWSHLNQLHLFMNGPRARRQFGSSPFRFYQRIRKACLLFFGLLDGLLPRDEAHHFLTAGRYLERVNMTERVLSIFLSVPPADPGDDGGGQPLHWSSLLRGCAADEAYLRHSRDKLDPAGVVHYLLLEGGSPRSIRFGVARCLEELRAAAGDTGGYASEAERLLGRLDGELRYMDVAEVFHRGLGQFLLTVREAVRRVDAEIHHAYFLA